ncbi:MAG: flippase-like domain-containing protein [bacterium]|nr:flippase-like domain-containing protein [bacterium]
MNLQKKILLTIAIAAALYLGASVWVGWERILDAFSRFHWIYLPLCLSLAFGNYLIRFTKWHYYLSILEIPVSRLVSFQIFLSGMVMSATPGKFGEVFKSYLVKSVNGDPISKTAPIVLAERLTDFIAFLLMALLGVTLLPNGALVFGGSVAVVAAILVLVSWRSFIERLIVWIETFPKIGHHAEKLLIAYESAYKLIAPKPLLWATLISLGSWFLECLAFYFVMRGFGNPVPLFSATFIYAFATILGALLMTPGGIGPTEGAIGGLLILLLEVPRGVALSATFLIRVCTLWFAVAVGLVTLTACSHRFAPAVEAIEHPAETPGMNNAG